MEEALSFIGGIIDLRVLALAIGAILLVFAAGYIIAKNRKTRAQKPGMHMLYETSRFTAAGCREVLGRPAEDDEFAYGLESAPAGGWFLHFTLHHPTGQMLDTLFLLQFEGENPARFSLTFKREAFGMREPVMPESMLDGFFRAKLGAERVNDTMA